MADKPRQATTASPASQEAQQPKPSKRGRFLKLAPKRVEAALSKLRAVRNLSSKASYEYTDSEREQMLAALREGLADVERAFAGKPTGTNGFTFKS